MDNSSHARSTGRETKMCRSEYDANRHLAASRPGLSCTRWRTPRRSLLSRIVAAVVGVLA